MKATIIVINYNDKIRVRRAINSALNQTYKNTEVIVVDDGSGDDVKNIYKEFEGSIRLIQRNRKDNDARTPSEARNAGISEATGDFIAVLDSDNYFECDFIEALIKSNADVAFCNWQIVGKQNYKVNIENVWDMQGIKDNEGLLKNYLMHTHLDHQCLLIRKSYLDKVGHYDTRLPRSQDCDMIVRLIFGGGEWSFNSKCLFTFEKHEDDQMKTIASIHGKTLWTLKNNINFTWLAGMAASSPYYFMSVLKGVNDFINSDEWKDEYKNSEFSKFVNSHSEMLNNERKEVVIGSTKD